MPSKDSYRGAEEAPSCKTETSWVDKQRAYWFGDPSVFGTLRATLGVALIACVGFPVAAVLFVLFLQWSPVLWVGLFLWTVAALVTRRIDDKHPNLEVLRGAPMQTIATSLGTSAVLFYGGKAAGIDLVVMLAKASPAYIVLQLFGVPL